MSGPAHPQRLATHTDSVPSQSPLSRGPTAPAVELRNLVMEFKVTNGASQHTVQAVNDLDFTAHRGEITALLGPNGAGKTTTLECAQGLLKPTSGTVRLLGKNPWGSGPGLRARVGVMLQDGGLPQSARPGEFLRHVSSMYRDPADMTQLMDRLGIDSFVRTPLRRLSGGQRQRVALAAALAGNPEVVFLDEPSAGLDPQSRGVVFELIGQLRQNGTAVILTTHLLDDAQRLADRVVIVDRGTVRAQGTVAELIAGDGNPGVLRVGLTPSQRARWEQSPPVLTGSADRSCSDDSSENPAKITVRLEGDDVVVTGYFGPELLTRLTRWLETTGELPTSMAMQPRTLEDVFLTVAGREIR